MDVSEESETGKNVGVDVRVGVETGIEIRKQCACGRGRESALKNCYVHDLKGSGSVLPGTLSLSENPATRDASFQSKTRQGEDLPRVTSCSAFPSFSIQFKQYSVRKLDNVLH